MTAATCITRVSDHPSAYLALNEGTQHFTMRGVEGLIAYAPAGRRFAIQVGGIHAQAEHKKELAQGFLEAMRSTGRRVVAVQLQREDALAYRNFPLSINQVGSSYSVDLSEWSLRGSKFVKLRNKISRARRAGVEVLEVGVDTPYSQELERKLDRVDELWLQSKGRGVKQLRLMVGDRGPVSFEVADRRMFVAMQNGEPVGYISYRKTFGRTAGWMHDLSRRLPNETPGILELCNATAVERFRDEQAGFLHFGFTPFVGLDPANEIPEAYSRATGWVMRMLGKYGSFVYPAKTQLEYKSKWRPQLVVPEYIAFEGGFSLSGLWSLLSVTQAI